MECQLCAAVEKSTAAIAQAEDFKLQMESATAETAAAIQGRDAAVQNLSVELSKNQDLKAQLEASELANVSMRKREIEQSNANLAKNADLKKRLKTLELQLADQTVISLKYRIFIDAKERADEWTHKKKGGGARHNI